MSEFPINVALRLHRERRGFSLETLAAMVENEAILRNISPKVRKVPRTHASMSRWETGDVEPKALGLELIASAYGITVKDLRKPPPETQAPPTRTVDVPQQHAETVAALLAALERKVG